MIPKKKGATSKKKKEAEKVHNTTAQEKKEKEGTRLRSSTEKDDASDTNVHYSNHKQKTWYVEMKVLMIEAALPLLIQSFGFPIHAVFFFFLFFNASI